MRSKYNSIASFIALCIGGLFLHYAEQFSHPWWGFFTLFVFVMAARLISVYYVSRMFEPAYHVDTDSDIRILDFFQQHRHSNFIVFVYYTAGMHFAILIASPFFAVYMLRDLHFTYLEYMAASATSVMVQFMTLHYWGLFADRFGNKRILKLTGYSLPFLPVLWLFSTDFFYIVVIQMVGGMVWAGFSLSMGNFVFDNVAPPQRAKAVAIYNTMNALAIVLGALTGGWLGSLLSPNLSLGPFNHTFISNLPLLFLISGSLRLVWVLLFIAKLKEVREVESFSMQDLIFRVTQLRPISGLKFDIFTGYQHRENGKGHPGSVIHTPDPAPPLHEAPSWAQSDQAVKSPEIFGNNHRPPSNAPVSHRPRPS